MERAFTIWMERAFTILRLRCAGASACLGSTGTNWAKVSRTRAFADISGDGSGLASATCAGAALGKMGGWVVSNPTRSGHFTSERMRKVALSTPALAWLVLSATALGEKA